ncbi:hypothetical protein HU675_0038225 [Bradyrhizobium septentrionale]|uniref:hypothetical protein n=1 Tax=Bradyrhizobium septentrionale TaxID=1404411 RepID=UPI001596631B|nr:hypothetical protein [Bradyrhizobium septentrionale]UGY23724.1 hypothetical protein HU675_0038225 [Bradyrhizobium septentrionale]
MADITDVTAYFAQTAFAAVYPGGTAQPSIAAMDIRIFEGWPTPDQLDLDMAGKMLDASKQVVARPGGPVASVSIFPMQGQGATVYQILDETYVVSRPTHGMTFTLADNVITVSGQPVAAEYLTVIADDAHVYSASGSTIAELLAALASQAQTDYPQVASTATTLTIPGTHSIVARQGGKGVLGKVLHRQRQSIMTTVWAPSSAIRGTLGKAIDVALKKANKITMPDSSQALVIYNRTTNIDEMQTQAIYRRDLVFDVEYATVELFDGYEITSTQVSITHPDNPLVTNAIS